MDGFQAQVAWYSSRGNVGIGTEGNFGRFKPDVVSPGTFVVSTAFRAVGHQCVLQPRRMMSERTYTDQMVDTNSLAYYNVSVPPNAVAVIITIPPNQFSPVRFRRICRFMCQQSGYPDPVNAPGSY